MKNLLSPYLDKLMLVFVDGILVYSKTNEEHEEHLVGILKFVKDHMIYAKFNKYDFFQSHV